MPGFRVAIVRNPRGRGVRRFYWRLYRGQQAVAGGVASSETLANDAAKAVARVCYGIEGETEVVDAGDE